MSSGLFHTEWYTDPPWERVSLSWLINYVRSIRSNPALTRALKADKDQFEMVPIPKEVIEHLASSRMASTSVGQIGDEKALQHSEQINTIVRNFFGALEKGDLDAANALVARGYKDTSGRDAAHLNEDLKKILGTIKGLRVVPLRTENMLVLGDKLVANIQVAWEATVQSGAKAETKTSFSQVELILDKGAKTWAISSIRLL